MSNLILATWKSFVIQYLSRASTFIENEMKFRQPLQFNCYLWKAEKRLSVHSFFPQHTTSVEYRRCEHLLYYLVVYSSCCSSNVYNWNSMLEVLLFGDYMVRCIFEFVSFLSSHQHNVYCIIMRFVFDKNINKVFKHFIYWTFRTKQKDVRENEIRIGWGESRQGNVTIYDFSHITFQLETSSA